MRILASLDDSFDCGAPPLFPINKDGLICLGDATNDRHFCDIGLTNERWRMKCRNDEFFDKGDVVHDDHWGPHWIDLGCAEATATSWLLRIQILCLDPPVAHAKKREPLQIRNRRLNSPSYPR
jgi:hypothetical protein